MPNPIRYPTYHRHTMIVALLLGLFIIINGWILAGYNNESWFRSLSTPLNYSILILGFLLISWIIYRLFSAIPKCPQCESMSLTYIGKYEIIDYPEGKSHKKRTNQHPSRSRHFRCDMCNSEYLVPLTSQEN